MKKYRIDLEKPLLVIKVEKGILACSYLNIQTFLKTDEACAVVSGVGDHEAMLTAVIKNPSDISLKAWALGVVPGDTGAQALAKMGGSSTPTQ